MNDSSKGCARISGRELWTVAAGFLLLTLVLTYPQVRHMTSHVGQEYDAEFSIWRLAWIAHQLPRDPRHLFDTNIFYPARDTLAFSDAILLPGLIGAPLLWVGVNPIAVYNGLLLGAFVASGVAMYMLARDLHDSRIAGWFAGVAFAFAPYRFGHYAHLELLWAWPIPLALRAFMRVITTRRMRDGVWLAVFVALQTWSCLYYALFLVTALAIMTPVLLLGRSLREITALAKPALLAVVVCGLLVAPYAWPYMSAERKIDTRTEQEVGNWSPTWQNYTTPPPRSWLYGRQRAPHNIELVLFPGVTVLAVALIGLWPPLDRRRIAYGVLLIVAVDLSLGANGLTYMTLYRTIGTYRNLRVPARLFIIVSAALALLGAEGCARVLRAVRRPAARATIGAALVGLVLAESAAMPLGLRPVEKTPSLYAWIQTQPPPIVLEWPVPDLGSLGATHEPAYMYYSIGHWHTLVNGYSGNYPASYIELLDRLRTFPSDESMRYLRGRSVDLVILHSEFDARGYQDARMRLDRRTDVRLERGGVSEHGEIAVYRVLK
ncbi:MAG TPA: hypothetical protein VG222_18560 [Vicinamibacterales bacterium]|nr:hypothetical protein [Vicinamibacterales bacterium]